MPLVQISLRRGKPAPYLEAVGESIYRAMRETFEVPEEDRFITIVEHDAPTFFCSRNYLSIGRSDDLVLIQVTCNNTRTVEQKAAFYKRTAERLGDNPGVRPQNVFINLVEVPPENWSFGMGVGQYIKS